MIHKLKNILIASFLFVICACNVAFADTDIFVDALTGLQGIKDSDDILVPANYCITETGTGFTYIIYDPNTKKIGFCDKTSGFILFPTYDELMDEFSTDPTYPLLVGKDGHYGYIDRTTGEVIIPFKYQSCCLYSEFVNGYAIIGETPYILDADDCPPKFVLIDSQGRVIDFPDGYIPMSHVADGTVVILRSFETVGAMCAEYNVYLYGLGMVDGTVLVEAAYDDIGDFYEGYAAVCHNGLWGHIDTKGKLVVMPMYALDAESQMGGYYFHNGIAELRLQNGSIIHIDYEGNIIQ